MSSTSPKRVRFVLMKPFLAQVEPVVEALRASTDFDAQVCFISSAAESIELDHDTDLVVTIHSIGDGIAAWLAELRKAGVPSLTLQDGIIEYAHCWLKPKSRNRYRPVLSDMIAVMGRSAAETIAQWGHPRDRMEIVGSPRFDDYAKNPAQDGAAILLTCANTPFRDDATQATFTRSMSDVAAFLNERRIDYTVRLPPAARAVLDDSLFGHAQRSDASARRGIASDIRACAAVITTMSTVALEAMALGRPTAILNYGNESSYMHTPWTVTHAEQIDSVVSELLQPPASKLELQALTLGEHLICDGNATTRVVALIRRMLTEAPPSQI